MSKPLDIIRVDTQVARVPDFNVLAPREQLPIEPEPFAYWRDHHGGVAVEFRRVRDDYLIRFVRRADFAVSQSASVVDAFPQPGTSHRTVRDLYLNQVLPMIRGHQGELVLHASAVAAPMGALGFVAPTGRGKSTLAAMFAREGIPFLTDDGLTLVRTDATYAASPNRPSFRLWHDSQRALDLKPTEVGTLGEKLRVGAGQSLPFHSEAIRLSALYLLHSRVVNAPEIRTIRRQHAMAELLNHSFLLDVGDPIRLRRHFGEVADLVQTIPCFTLDYPRDYAALPAVIAAVLEHAAVKVED